MKRFITVRLARVRFVYRVCGLAAVQERRIPQRGLGIYLAGMSVVAALMWGAGYSGGEMLLDSDTTNAPSASARPTSPPDQRASVAAASHCSEELRAFATARMRMATKVRTCTHLDWTDEQIATRIRNGKKGQMPAFAGKIFAAQNP